MMNNRSVRELFEELTVDDWRTEHPFSIELEQAQNTMWGAQSKDEIRSALLEWLGRWQPCLFGRLASRMGALATHIISESDLLTQSEEELAEGIAKSRLQWAASTFRGLNSGFVLLIVSARISRSVPNDALAELARRLCSLYLVRDDIAFDSIYHDEAFLAVDGEEQIAWKWLAGINYFCANGDGRWWQDHRIPGGMAFSTNSVGHLVKSRLLRTARKEFLVALGVEPDVAEKIPVDSLGSALGLAMQTIHLASSGPSGKATELIDRTSGTPAPPIELKSYLAGKEHRFYRGYYHTDHTLPSPYFEPFVTRPTDIEPFTLDFSYLFDRSVNNPDYITMGLGRRIRSEELYRAHVDKVEGEQIQITSSRRLVEALRSESSLQ